MPKPSLLGAALAALVCIAAPASRAAAMPPAAPAVFSGTAPTFALTEKVCFGCRRSDARAAREYWQWDHRPVWDDPWLVLRPNFWGSPEPHLVPADTWACKWHLPSSYDRRRHHRRCRPWPKAAARTPR